VSPFTPLFQMSDRICIYANPAARVHEMVSIKSFPQYKDCEKVGLSCKYSQGGGKCSGKSSLVCEYCTLTSFSFVSVPNASQSIVRRSIIDHNLCSIIDLTEILFTQYTNRGLDPPKGSKSRV
jgi:hypothetical protein